MEGRDVRPSPRRRDLRRLDRPAAGFDTTTLSPQATNPRQRLSAVFIPAGLLGASRHSAEWKLTPCLAKERKTWSCKFSCDRKTWVWFEGLIA